MKNGRSLKTKQESAQYKSAVKNLKGYENTDSEEKFSTLQGSDEDFMSPPTSEEKLKPVGAKRKKIKKFLKDHLFEEIISVIVTIILAVAGWNISNTIELQKQTAVISYRIEQAEKMLIEIEDEKATKDYLQQELQILKLQLENSTTNDLSEIKIQIKLIEQQIEYLTSKNT